MHTNTVAPIYIVALRKEIEQALTDILSALARNDPRFLVHCVEEIMHASAKVRSGELNAIATKLVRSTDRKKTASGEDIVKLLESVLAMYRMGKGANRMRNAFFIGTPHAFDQVHPLFDWEPRAHVIYIGHGLDEPTGDGYHHCILDAVREFKKYGKVTVADDDQPLPYLVKDVLIHADMKPLDQDAWIRRSADKTDAACICISRWEKRIASASTVGNKPVLA
jgi:hypothetical protein